MVSHVSVRLLWHDSGWDGAICRDPAGNVWCEAHEHVRDNKDVGAEVAKAGRRVNVAGVAPGCEMSIQAFSSERNTIRVWPPDWLGVQDVRPIDLTIDKHSTGMWPYEDMWGEDGGYKSNDERRAIAQEFFNEVRKGESLAFFYVDERNPMFVDTGDRSPSRVLAGISRITEIGEISEWEQIDLRGETNMIWSVPFRHDFPRDGIRFPLQAILAAVPDPTLRSDFVVPLDGGLRTDFRYGSARLSQDRALAVVERAIAALGRLESSHRLEISVAAELEWLNMILLELWEERGPYPGYGSLLLALGCARGSEIQRDLIPVFAASGKNAGAQLFAALNGEDLADFSPYVSEMADAVDEWQYLSTDDQELARLLTRMELTPRQMKVLLNREQRARHLVPEDAAELTANPYLICERFVPDQEDELIGFLTVDHALVPHESMSETPVRVPARDPRRLRALLMEVLRDRASDGDTFVAAEEALVLANSGRPRTDRAMFPPIGSDTPRWLRFSTRRSNSSISTTCVSWRCMRSERMRPASRMYLRNSYGGHPSKPRMLIGRRSQRASQYETVQRL